MSISDDDDDHASPAKPTFAPFSWSHLDTPGRYFRVSDGESYELDQTLLPALCSLDEALANHFSDISANQIHREIGGALFGVCADDIIEAIGMQLKKEPMIRMYGEVRERFRVRKFSNQRFFKATGAFTRKLFQDKIQEWGVGGDQIEYVVAEGVVKLIDTAVERSGRTWHEVYLEALAYIKALAHEWSSYPEDGDISSMTAVQLINVCENPCLWTIKHIASSMPKAFSDNRSKLSFGERAYNVCHTLSNDYGITTAAKWDSVLVNPYEDLSEEQVITRKILKGDDEDDRSKFPGWDAVRDWVQEP